ncbi:hypothetical protein BKA69DRAFT_1073867 [Paraphysoderma sedebokerense]|nr:hypothetical protein BKA69DRAFT_1073867 [Paraphysoderma sedebokerense]
MLRSECAQTNKAITAHTNRLQASSKIPIPSSLNLKSHRTNNKTVNPVRVNAGSFFPNIHVKHIAIRVITQWKKFAKASKHHRFYVTRKVLASWSKQTQQTKHQWRIEIKATVKYRFELTLKVYSAWRSFIVERRKEKETLARADGYYRNILQQKAIFTLTQYIFQRRIKNRNTLYTIHLRQSILKRRCLVTWLCAHRRLAQQLLNESLALRIWSKQLYRQAFLKWKLQSLRMKRLREEESLMTRQFAKSMLRKHYKAWIMFCRSQRSKQNRKAHAQHVHRISILERTMCIWKLKSYQLLKYRSSLDLAETFRTKRLKFDCVKRLKSALKERSELATMYNQMDEYRAMVVKKQGLRAFKNYVDIVCRADKLYSARIVQKYWMLWLEKCREIERSELSKGILYYKEKILSEVFITWRENHKLLKLQTDSEARAILYFQKKALSRCLSALFHHANSRKRHRRERDAVQRRYEFELIALCWKTWCWMKDESQTEKKKLHQASEFYLSLLKNRYLRRFSAYVQYKKARHDDMEWAVTHRNRQVAQLSLRSWYHYAVRHKLKESNMQTAQLFCKSHELRRFTKIWHKIFILRRREQLKWRLAIARSERLTLKRAIICWKHYATTRRLSGFSKERIKIQMHQRFLFRCFFVWRTRYAEVAQNLIIINDWRKKRQAETLIQIIQSWRDYAIRRIEKTEARQMRQQAIVTILSKNQMERALIGWIIYYRKEVVQRLAKNKSSNWSRCRLLLNTIKCWREKTIILQKQKRHEWLAAEFYSRSLLKFYYKKWYQSRPNWRQLHYYFSTQPIIYWSTRVQRTVLEAWRDAVGKKKYAKRRIKEMEAWKIEQQKARGPIGKWTAAAGRQRVNEAEELLTTSGVHSSFTL